MLIQWCYNHFAWCEHQGRLHGSVVMIQRYYSVTELPKIINYYTFHYISHRHDIFYIWQDGVYRHFQTWCVCVVFFANSRFSCTIINFHMAGTWHYLLTSNCRQSMDVSMIAQARKRVRSAHGSPLSDTTSSHSCTPATKARPPTSTCGRQNRSKRTGNYQKNRHITYWMSVHYLHG